MRVTVLVENSACKRGLLAEHGLAFWIKGDHFRVLFDAGQSDLVVRNAERLGIDLATADAVVLSHGHYDHTGGFAAASEKLRSKRVFAHPAAFLDKYTRDPGAATGRSIGMPAASKHMILDHTHLIPTGVPVTVGGGLRLTGEIPRVTPFEDTDGTLFADPGCTIRDSVPDDQALFCDTPEGLVVVLGCAHAGVVNTLTHIRSLCPSRPFHALVGGLHLGQASDARLTRTVEALREFGVNRLYPQHCTGFQATLHLAQALPGRVLAAPVGTILDFTESRN